MIDAIASRAYTRSGASQASKGDARCTRHAMLLAVIGALLTASKDHHHSHDKKDAASDTASAPTMPVCECNTYSNWAPNQHYDHMCSYHHESGINECQPKYSNAHDCDGGHVACSFGHEVASPTAHKANDHHHPPPPPPPPPAAADSDEVQEDETTAACSDTAHKKHAEKCAKASSKKCAKPKFADHCCASCAKFPVDHCSEKVKCAHWEAAGKLAKKCVKEKSKLKCPATCQVGECRR
jgi:hypothetical protein